MCVLGMPYLGHGLQKGNRGLLSEIFKAVYEPEHIEYMHKELPYIRALAELRAGEVQCSLSVKDNHKEFPQGKYALATYDLTVVYLRKTGFENLQSLAGTRVAYLHGFALKEFLSVKFTPQLIFDLTSGFHLLDREHVAYILGDGKLLRRALHDSQLPSSGFAFTDIRTYAVHPIFAPNDLGRRYRDIYDRRMKDMLKSGELAEIMRGAGLPEPAVQKVLEAN